MIYFWDNQYLLSYLCLMLLWIIAAYSEFWEKNISPIVNDLFFRPDLLSPDLMSTNKVLTMDEIMHVKSVNMLLENQEGEDMIEQTREQYSIQKLGWYAQYKDGKKGANFSLQWLDVIADFFEKVRNLVLWTDPSMTSLMVALLLIIFIVVTFLPLRFILFLACAYKFACGRRW